MKGSLISKIALIVGMVVTIAVAVWVFFGPTEEVALTTNGTTLCPTHLDHFLYWSYALCAVGVVLLVIFALIEVVRMFQVSPKNALATIAAFAAFVAVLVVCYVLGDATEYHAIVNGEEVFYNSTEMKVVEMWIYAIYALLGVTALLVVGFGAKKLITK